VIIQESNSLLYIYYVLYYLYIYIYNKYVRTFILHTEAYLEFLLTRTTVGVLNIVFTFLYFFRHRP